MIFLPTDIALPTWADEVRALYLRTEDMEVEEFERLLDVALTGIRPDHRALPAYLPQEKYTVLPAGWKVERLARPKRLADNDPRKSRPDEWTRENAQGERFHTYVDPDRWPSMARADEALWRLEQQDDDRSLTGF